MAEQPLGVGFIGAGSATQAIHLPTLARHIDRFRPVTVMDVDRALAQAIALRCGARPAYSVEEVVGSDEVDVVVICSPDRYHASQIGAACSSGKRGIICEKPLATTEAEAAEVARALDRADTKLVVGTQHVYDPGWRAAARQAKELIAAAHTVKSRIVLPYNDRFEDLATQLEGIGLSSAVNSDEVVSIRRLVLGLLIHDIPLIRACAPDHPRTASAQFVPPFGAAISVQAGRVAVDFTALMRITWSAYWSLDVWSPDGHLEVSFPPSYVHAGSSTWTLTTAAGRESSRSRPADGYDAEWLELHEIVTAGRAPLVPVRQAVDDLTYALRIADQCAQLLSGSVP
jgi:predicted dehydrogenase